MITKEQKQKWLEALRSGKYKQGTASLKRGDKFCCLGVLADVLGCEWQSDSEQIVSEQASFKNLYYGTYFLPEHIIEDSIQNVLSRMNDQGKSFDEIADWIESMSDPGFVT